MNRILQIFFRLGLIFFGICFFIFLLFLFLLAFIFFGIKQLWWKIIGRKPQQNMNGFRFNPKSGFSYFYTRASSYENSRGRKIQELEDVTDVEVKQMQPPPKDEHADT